MSDEFQAATPNRGHDMRRAYIEIIRDAPLSFIQFVATATITATQLMEAGTSTSLADRLYAEYLDKFQPFRWRAKA